jgi:hypothetical protein
MLLGLAIAVLPVLLMALREARHDHAPVRNVTSLRARATRPTAGRDRMAA